MVELSSLWLPIVLSAVTIFIVSAMFWMVFPHHKGDYKKLPNEDGFIGALRPMNIPTGLYAFPHMADCNKMKDDPTIKAKFEDGPLGILHVWSPNAMKNMGSNMALSLVFYLVTSVFVAYVATLALSASANYLDVFQVTGTAAIMAYCFASIPQAIWFGTPLRNVIACVFDGIVYGLLTAGFFGWLWPKVATIVNL